MTIKWSPTTAFLLLLVFTTSVTPFFIVRKLSSGSTSYHDNPAISPLNLMTLNDAILRLTQRRTPDLPESFSPSAKRFSFTDSSLKAASGRYPTFF
ncbi:hypothetical protein GCK32_014668 [Trichostrongylus colubriformis]|uniref:Uncharacterized protein n=1 Tax=Trichostrongylus colubriformis TaxID=6319 RepID=A0AAN8FLR1_TRICO